MPWRERCAAGILAAALLTPPPCALAGQGSGLVGDCDEDGEVRVNEVLVGVNIALGSAMVSACPAFDSDGSGTVTIDELTGAVNAALRGMMPSPTPTPLTATPTSTATPTLTPRPIAPPYRQSAAALAAARQAALATAAKMALLELALSAAVPPSFAIAGGGSCAGGGEVSVRCTAAGAQATRRIEYTECRIALGTGTVQRDGVIVQTVVDPEFCARTLESNDSATITFTGYEQRERSPSGAALAEINLDLTLQQAPTGRDGCAGPDRNDRLDGTVMLTCSPGAASVQCPGDGAELTLTLGGVTLDRRSSGAPCTRGVIASGSVWDPLESTCRHASLSIL